VDIISRAIVTVLNKDTQTRNATQGDYQALIEMMAQQTGKDSELIDAIHNLEKKPNSPARQAVLAEEIITSRVSNQPMVVAAAEKLLRLSQTPPSPARQTMTPLVPLHRPPRPTHLLGRENELGHLTAALAPGKIINLCGPVGVGTSTLIAALVWQLAPKNYPPTQFPDGLIYYSFFSQPRTDIALEEIGRLYGEDPLPSPYESVQRTLKKRQCLIIIDGARYADDLSGLISTLGPNCGLIFSEETCAEVAGVTVENIIIAPLTPARAVNLLETWAGHLPKPQAEKICERLGYLPLSMRLAGAYLSNHRNQVAHYLDWLNSTPLAQLSSAGRQVEGISLVIEHTMDMLDEHTKQVAAVTGLLAPLPFKPEVITYTMAAQPHHGLFDSIRSLFRRQDDHSQHNHLANIARSLHTLSDYGILEWTGDRYKVSHPVVYNYVRQHLTPPPEIFRRLATYFTAQAWEQTAQGPAGEAQLATERPHFMRVLNECVEWKEWEAAHGLAAAVEDFLDRQGFLSDRITANEVGLMASWQLGRPSEGAWLGNLGDTYRTMGHAKWAVEHFQKALQTARQTGDRHGEGNSLGNLGLAYRDLGQIDLAVQYLRQAQAIFEDIRSPSAGLVRDWLFELEDWEVEKK
jgi:hypothetical protein